MITAHLELVVDLRRAPREAGAVLSHLQVGDCHTTGVRRLQRSGRPSATVKLAFDLQAVQVKACVLPEWLAVEQEFYKIYMGLPR